jgi:2',3'-cyclic-nucleotide 2'-phosphodiesterase (5'-nucleotidase family)
MVEVMNAMNYDAAAIGNHEFDFKLEALETRTEQANFPFLSANIREKNSGDIPDFATPYIIKNVDGVNVGIIGLSSLSTPTTTFPANVSHLEFMDYEDALEEIVPTIKADGAEILIIVGHICKWEMENLVSTAKEMGISVIGGGHCHELMVKKSDGVGMMEGGSNMRSYAKCVLSYDLNEKSVTDINLSIHQNPKGKSDPEIQTIVDYWKDREDEELSEVIGYANLEISRSSDEMYNMITDSWLYSFPNADISITNKGGIRQSIPAGNITLATIVGVLPFENTILELELTGNELINCLNEYLVVGGMTTIGGYSLSDGTPIYADSTYSVLTTDYIYSAFYYFSDYDPAPYNTSTHWRQPVIDWIESLETSQDNPLNNYLDSTPRQ